MCRTGGMLQLDARTGAMDRIRSIGVRMYVKKGG